MKCLHVFFSFFLPRDEIPSRQKRVNSKRVFTREISSRDERRPRTKSSLSMAKCLLLFTSFPAVLWVVREWL